MSPTLSTQTDESPVEGMMTPAKRVIPDRNMPAPTAMIFLNWIDPPVGFDMSSIDPNHHFYRVKIMSISQANGATPLEVPFAEAVQISPLAPSPAVWQFQMIGVLPPDP